MRETKEYTRDVEYVVKLLHAVILRSNDPQRVSNFEVAVLQLLATLYDQGKFPLSDLRESIMAPFLLLLI